MAEPRKAVEHIALRPVAPPISARRVTAHSSPASPRKGACARAKRARTETKKLMEKELQEKGKEDRVLQQTRQRNLREEQNVRVCVRACVRACWRWYTFQLCRDPGTCCHRRRCRGGTASQYWDLC